MDSPDVAACRIALCQIETRPWDVEGNLARTRAALEQAARLGAHLAITPECVNTGYPDHTADNREAWRSHALGVGDVAFEALRADARRLGLDVVLGFAERAAEGRLFNTAAHLTADGEVAALYRKVHCRPFESTAQQGHFEPGREFVVSTLRRGALECRLGLMICFDREIAESVRCLRALGAELIACPLATNTARLDAPELAGKIDNEQVTRTRAAENEVAIIVVNHAARFNGGSFGVGPLGEVLGQLGAQPATVLLDVPLARVRQAHADPLGWMGWGYRRPAVYAPCWGA